VTGVVDHVGIRVNDLCASRNMYEAELGFSVQSHGEFRGDAGRLTSHSLESAGDQSYRRSVAAYLLLLCLASGMCFCAWWSLRSVLIAPGSSWARGRGVAALGSAMLAACGASFVVGGAPALLIPFAASLLGIGLAIVLAGRDADDDWSEDVAPAEGPPRGPAIGRRLPVDDRRRAARRGGPRRPPRRTAPR
jgi:hypothetical protein